MAPAPQTYPKPHPKELRTWRKKRFLQRHEALMIRAYKEAQTVKGEVWKPNPNLMQRN
jgi:hypothetical protein